MSLIVIAQNCPAPVRVPSYFCQEARRFFDTLNARFIGSTPRGYPRNIFFMQPKFSARSSVLLVLTIAATCSLTLSSCAATHPVARADYSLIIPSNAETYEEQKNQRFLLGDRIGQAVLPIYPPGLVALHLPAQLTCVEIDIDEDGKVAAARRLIDANACPEKTGKMDEQFLRATMASVEQWLFHPARLCTFQNTSAVTDDCSGENVTIERVPVRLAYRFTFSIDDDGPRVRSQTVDSR